MTLSISDARHFDVRSIHRFARGSTATHQLEGAALAQAPEELADVRVKGVDMTRSLAKRGSHPFRWPVGAAILVCSFVVGGLTSMAQGVLPDSLRSIANSPSGWTLLTVAILSSARLRLLPSVCLGAVSFVCLVLGYTCVSELRGLTYDPAFWVAVGLVAGPAVGWATSAAFKADALQSALGSSLIAGIAITDAVYGLTVIADTTSPVYWWIVGVAGAMFVGLVALRQRLPRRYVAVQIGLTLLWIALGSAGYAVLNSGLRG